MAGLVAVGAAQAGSFSSNFADVPSGATAQGTAVIEEGVLKLTVAEGSQLGGFIIDELDAGTPVTGFTATFKLLIGGGSAADGFSFNFGPDVPDGGISEEGAGSGLSICFDTYDNGGGEAPAIDVKKAGVIIASVKGNAGSFRSNAFKDIRIDAGIDGSLSLSVGGVVIYTNLIGGFSASTGRFGLGARTGGATDNHFVDDLTITTRTDEPTHPVVIAATPQGAGVTPAAVVNIQLQDKAAGVNLSSVKLSFDGTEVAATKSKTGGITTVTYDPPGLLPKNSAHQVRLTYTDTGTPATAGDVSFSFTVANYVGIPATAKVTADTTKPGFLWRVFANPANQVNSNARALAALNGELLAGDGTPLPNLADPTAQGPALGQAASPNPENAAIQFEIEGVINLSQIGGEANGNFPDDEQMPGIPATDSSTDGIAAEITTFIELPVGATTMGVNSDDGFRTTSGNPSDAMQAIRLGEFDGGRGAANTIFTIVVEEAGVYPFRTVWEEGGGGANIEWFSVKADGTKVLVNDRANGGLKAYRKASVAVPPFIRLVVPDPVPRQANVVNNALKIVLEDGVPNKLDDNSVALKFDGNTVTPAKARVGNRLTVTYALQGLLIPSDQHSAELTFKDSTGTYTRTESWNFRNLKNLVLPAPKITEDFESYPEDSQPTGWVAWNYTAHNDDGRDITNQRSESYENWVLVNTNNLPSIDDDVVVIAPGQTFNGVPVTGEEGQIGIASGNVLYAESDSRGNADALGRGWEGQSQFIISAPFNCSQIKDVVMTINALIRQNQDSIGSLEYSVDCGATWLPIAYFLDTPDIKLNADGTVDAVRTFKDANADTSSWVIDGVPYGDNYGACIGAVIEPSLGDYCVPRINDDPVEGKRIEVYRLPAAGNKSDVRLRFGAMGTDSWYVAFDNIAFYDVPATTTTVRPKFNAVALAGGNATISWTGTGTLQEATKVDGPWSNSASQANPQAVAATGTKFFRIKQ